MRSELHARQRRRCLLLAVAAALIGAGCDHRVEDELYEPKTLTRDPQVESTVAALEDAVNAKDAAAVCSRYAFPSSRCVDVWRKRLAAATLPVELSVTKIVSGCAGDARAEIAIRRGALALNSVTIGWDAPGTVNDVGFGDGRASLVIPRYGNCAYFHDGSAGDAICDPAAHFRDEAEECRRR